MKKIKPINIVLDKITVQIVESPLFADTLKVQYALVGNSTISGVLEVPKDVYKGDDESLFQFVVKSIGVELEPEAVEATEQVEEESAS